jgi:hypothetical protein
MPLILDTVWYRSPKDMQLFLTHFYSIKQQYGGYMKSVLSFGFYGEKCWTSEIRRTQTVHNNTYKFCMKRKKGKFVPLLIVTWAPRHEGVLGEWRHSFTHPFTSTLDGGEWSASRPGHFTDRERAPGTPWVGCWVGPRTVLDAVVKRKILSPHRESNPTTPIADPVA